MTYKNRNWVTPRTAITKDEHDRLVAERGRPLGDRPIGGTTAARRQTDAAASAAISAIDGGSVTEAETLAEIVRQRRAETKPVPSSVCGTVDGFDRHVGRNEWPCVKCRRAKKNETTEDA